MSLITVRTSDGPPKAYVLDLTPETSDVDLSDVSAAVFKVQAPSGTVTTWTAALSNQSTTSLRLTYTFAPTQFTAVGVYLIYALLTVTGGTLTSEPRALRVRGPFEVSTTSH